MNDRFPEGLGSAVARVRSADGTPVGSGFLLAPGTVVTCAHVVAQALRTDARAESAPTSPVTVEFPLQRGNIAYAASVSAWRPVAADGTGDIALLRLPEDTPDIPTTPVPLAGAGDVWDHRFRILAFPATAEHGAWIGGRLLGAVGQGWISMEAEGTAHHISPGCSGAPVWDEQLAAVVGMTVATDRGRTAGTSYLIPAAALLDLQPGLRRCPYRGLDAFREEDAEHFFGREKETRRLLDAVDRHLVVPVVGPSGSGKTSLVRAGALPHLRADGHTVSEIRPLPGTRASLTLARALAPLLEPDAGVADQERGASKLAALLDSEGGPAAAALGLRLLHRCGPRGHVFFLNQLEETVAAEPATARTLLALVVALASVPADGKRLRVLATLRSACLDDLVESATADILSDCAQIVAPLGRTGLLRAIEEPVVRVPGLTLEPGLAERIVDEAENEPGSLPMVEFLLTELWAREKGVRLTHAGYEALGGVAGALSAHAETWVGKVIVDHGEEPVRRLFTQLARPDEAGGFSRKPVRLAPLPAKIRSAAEALATRTRFVRITHGPEDEPIVDLAHEELVRSWPRLRGWLEESRDFRSWQERLLQSLTHWTDTGEETGALLRGTMLATSLEKAANPSLRVGITQLELEYIEASHRHQERGLRRWRLAAAALVVLALLAGVLAGEAWRQGSALEERGRAIASRALAEESSRIADTSPVSSVRLALAAWRNARGKEARQALLEAYLLGASVVRGYRGQGSEQIRGFDMTPDGAIAVTTSQGPDGAGHAQVWSGIFEGRARPWRVRGVPPGIPETAELSDDGTLLAIASEDGSVAVWDVPSRTRLWMRPEPALGARGRPETAALDFSADGRRLLRVAVNRTPGGEGHGQSSSLVQVWGARGGRPVPASQKGVPPGPEVGDAALARDGSEIVYLTRDFDDPRAVEDPVAEVRDVADGTVREKVPEAEWIARRGAAVITDEGYGRHSVRAVKGSEEHPERRFLAVESAGPDVTGRYVVELVGSLSVTDLETGLRYGVPGGPGVGDLVWKRAKSAVAVLPRGSRPPLVLLALGSDLLVLRTVADRDPPLPDVSPHDWSSSDTYIRSVDGAYRAQFSGSDDGSSLVVARRGTESRAVPLALSEFDEWPDGATFTHDNRYLLLWNSDVLSARRTGRPATADTAEFPERIHRVLAVYGSTVVVLTDSRLIRYDVVNKKRQVLAENPCRGEGWACRDVAVRPGHKQVAVADAFGRVRFWNVATREAPQETGILLAAGGELHSKTVVFDPSGTMVATSPDKTTVVRRQVESDRRVGRTVRGSVTVSARMLSADGTLLTEDIDQMALWRPEDTQEPFVTLPFSAATDDLRLSRHHLIVEQADAQMRIPLRPDDWHHTLCRSWDGAYSRAEERLLERAGATLESPCP
ncbi:trypsin-like peptidase domain-containing protein [Streptomyces sp. NPDC057002]|uniref:nSTAND1 domain-containing NTPase n=1 Tax=Streptomyces sp. NPDC057002 TaxID=3345992 RepID=UPI003645381C